LTLYARQWCFAPEDALQETLIDLAQLGTARNLPGFQDPIAAAEPPPLGPSEFDGNARQASLPPAPSISINRDDLFRELLGVSPQPVL
jgi:hypothetical protein